MTQISPRNDINEFSAGASASYPDALRPGISLSFPSPLIPTPIISIDAGEHDPPALSLAELLDEWDLALERLAFTLSPEYTPAEYYRRYGA